MKYFLRAIIILLFLFGGFFGYQKYQLINAHISQLHYDLDQKDQELLWVKSLEDNISSLQKRLHDKESSEKIYSIIAGGDIMMDRGVEAKIKKLNKDYHFSFDLIRDDLQSADLVFANLEGSLSDVGRDLGSKYSFRFEPAVADALAHAGIDIVSLANNHMLDWGRDSLCATTDHLDRVGISYVGAGCNVEIAEREHIIDLGDTRIAFLAYTEFYQGAHAVGDTPGMSEWNIPQIKNKISELDQNDDIDLVMVSVHWGAEYKHRATDHQVSLGQQLIDAGADVIIGHHPHVDQEIERYADGWIIYSLGNFVFDQSWSKETMQGLLAEIQVQNGRVYDVVPKPIQLNENYQPSFIK